MASPCVRQARLPGLFLLEQEEAGVGADFIIILVKKDQGYDLLNCHQFQ